MGRVAKYKKVKSFDPYSKQNRGNIDLSAVGVWGLGDNGRKKKKRSLKAEKLRAKKHRNRATNGKAASRGGIDDNDGGFDVPPSEGDEFDMADLASNNNKNDKSNNAREESYDQVVTSTGNVANIPKTDADEQKIERLLRVDQQLEQKSEKEKQAGHGRMEGESKRAYAKRTRAETRQIIKQSAATTKNLEKLQKKKEFLKNKKKNKKRKAYDDIYDNGNNNDGNNDDDWEFDNRRGGAREKETPVEAPIRFNEQAERPPVFRQIPRGAKARAANATKGMTEHQVEAERDAMELMRRRVQAQYKAIKSKRRHAGDFHL
eukprot:jgi/Psemu1/183149/e_gw1.30.206.1